MISLRQSLKRNLNRSVSCLDIDKVPVDSYVYICIYHGVFFGPNYSIVFFRPIRGIRKEKQRRVEALP